MKITILALGHRMPKWVTLGVEEYTRRMPAEVRVEVVELKPEDRANKTTARVLAAEAERLELAIPRQSQRIVCDERGKPLTTPMLAAWMQSWMRDGVQPCFIIGSADGLAESIKATATQTVSVSGCVLPHGMVRVILAEQLYRAWSLMHNHPYHRE
ncbi:MAG: 23S rRNA (pseudouridine(1915)-N(3))-methyltransferase RlmH [Burkholderiales bacterium]|jgi:23S rRNA (pseudouridine1915-N3)-methyltransferase|nr:23S rRNA (pseudouridine(1915)-N(3))-methyltransferase RlmH [Nitrosomonadaceae bacterium]